MDIYLVVGTLISLFLTYPLASVIARVSALYDSKNGGNDGLIIGLTLFMVVILHILQAAYIYFNANTSL